MSVLQWFLSLTSCATCSDGYTDIDHYVFAVAVQILVSSWASLIGIYCWVSQKEKLWLFQFRAASDAPDLSLVQHVLVLIVCPLLGKAGFCSSGIYFACEGVILTASSHTTELQFVWTSPNFLGTTTRTLWCGLQNWVFIIFWEWTISSARSQFNMQAVGSDSCQPS